MEEYIRAFIEFITQVFAALATFLGWTVTDENLTTAEAEDTTAEPVV